MGNLCSKASEGCAKACLYSAGRGAFSNVQNARINKTKLFFQNNKQFMLSLQNDISLFESYCIENKIQGYVRLNGTSDVDWQKLKIDSVSLFEKFPNIIFYDYTKDFSKKSIHKNYDLTYSRSEVTKDNSILNRIKQGTNVAIVFDKLPLLWNGIEVVNGDLNDLRPLDKKGVIVGLVAKGSAKKDDSGFVVKTNRIITKQV